MQMFIFYMRELPKNIMQNLQYGGEKIELENF